MVHSNIFDVEKGVEEYWRDNDTMAKALWKTGERGKFYFLDGPPYATQRIHVGTAWNKILKDAVLRYKRMTGYTVWARPGYDTHGLPIEVMVEQKLGTGGKRQIMEEVGLDKFNHECKRYAEKFVGVLTKQFSSLSVWMDWEDPYLTYTNDYISSVWWAIKEAHRKGLLQEDSKVFHWCPRCETVLSEHEVAQEYREVEDPSIYVKLPLKGREDEYLLIWTTTPWTLPSNVAVMVNPDLRYTRINLNTGEILYLASKRLREAIREEYVVLDEFYGDELEGMEYVAPLTGFVPALEDLAGGHRIVLSREYVSEEEGTGCVHTAPEHGREDFEVAQENGLPTITIVDGEGRFTEEAGKYAGKRVFDANEEINSDLEKLGLLYRMETVVHKYPHCWRCRTPLILKSTRQWVLKTSNLREDLARENERIRWVPGWAGAQRFRDWVEKARDWVVSRQRFWGTPLPIWICEKCGTVEVLGSMEELVERAGRDLEDLHRPYIDGMTWSCGCGGTMRRIPDVIDVWLDAGSASWANLGYPSSEETFEELWPVDFITEGHDQTRGWFYSLLALGLIAFGYSPFETVLMHGFALDSQGKGMHKSLGNVLYPEELVEKYGVDPLRVFLLKNTTWMDAPISTREIEETIRILNIVTNIYEFYSTYAGLDGFRADGHDVGDSYGRLMEEDKWILSRFEEVLRKATREMERFYTYRAIREILHFAVEDLSRRYLKTVRRRVWIEEEAWEKTAVYLTLHHILKELSLVLAPFAPHFAEHYYRKYVGGFDEMEPQSVHLASWPSVEEAWIDKELEERYDYLWKIVAATYSMRQRKGMKIRQPLREVLLPREIASTLSDRMLSLLRVQANVLEVKGIDEGEEPVGYEVEARVDLMGPKYRDKTSRVVQALRSKPPEEVAIELSERGRVALDVDSEVIELSGEEVVVKVRALDPYLYEAVDEGRVFLNLRLTEDVLALGFVRDVVRRVQEARKKLGLEMMEPIEVMIEAEDDEVVEAVKRYEGYVREETRAERIIYQVVDGYELLERGDIDGVPLRIGIKRLG